MATASTPGPAPIAYESPLPGLVNLLKYFGGENQRTENSGTGVNVQQGQTGALEAILAQMSAPGNLQNIVGQLFAQGAAQVPGLTAQFANATGSRVTNNSSLAQALALLQQNIAQSIAAAAVDQQKTVMTGAAELGKINKTNTETQTKSANQKTAAPSGTKDKSIAALLGMTLLNKTGVGDKLKGIGAAIPSGGGSDGAALPNISIGDAGFDGDILGGAGGSPDAFAFDTPVIDGSFNEVGSAFDSPQVFDAASELSGISGFEGFDFGSGVEINEGFDAASTAVEAYELADYGEAIDSGSELLYTDADYSEVLDFDFGSFFADGGLVGRDGRPVNMVRNRPFMGQTARPLPQLALNASTAPQQTQMKVPQGKLGTSQQKRKRSESIVDPQESGGDNPSVSPTAPGIPGGINPAKSVAIGLLGLALGAPPAAAVAAALKNAVVQGLVSAMFGRPTTVNTREMGGEEEAMGMAAMQGMANETQTIGIGDETNTIGPAPGEEIGGIPGAMDEGTGYRGENPNPAEGAVPSGDSGTPAGDVSAGDATNSGDAMGGAHGGTDGGGTSGGGDASAGDSSASADGGDGSGDGSGGSGDSGGGPGGDGSGDGSGNGYKDGGKVKGKATGIDKKLIHVTPGEYVLPVDTVQYLGLDVLDEIVAATHVPIRR